MADIYIKEPIDIAAKVALSAHDLVGTGTSDNHKVINKNLKIVSLICNVFVLGMCCWLVYRLTQHMRASKSNS